MIDVAEKDRRRQHKQGWAMLMAAGAFIVYVAYDQGQTRGMDEQMGRSRIGLSHERFMKECGDESLIRRIRQNGKHEEVILYLDDYRQCQHQKEEEPRHD